MKLCDCGCGQEAGIYTKTNSKIGAKKGEPRKYIYGHNNRKAFPDRFCILCGRKIKRSVFNDNRKEDPGIHAKRKFCSSKCSSDWHRGDNATNWKDGKRTDRNGYIYILVGKEHPLADPYGYALEHRVVAEEKIGRRLKELEVVHHINGNKHDNRPENLEVVCDSATHLKGHREANSGREWNELPLSERAG